MEEEETSEDEGLIVKGLLALTNDSLMLISTCMMLTPLKISKGRVGI